MITDDVLTSPTDAADSSIMSDATDDLQGVEEVQAAIARVKGPRVLQVLPALNHGGVERGTVDIARYLIGQDWTPLVVSNGGAMEVELKALGARCFNLPIHAKNPLTMKANVALLHELIREHDVQLVHARSRAPAWSAYYAAKRAGVPFMTTFHSLYSGSGHFLKRQYNAIMTSGDRVIAISDHVADHIAERYGVGPDRLRVIPRGVDLKQFNPESVGQDRIRRLAKSWQIDRSKQVVMLPGRISWRKGHTWLLRALKELLRRPGHADVTCVMVGHPGAKGGYANQVEKMIIELELEEKVWLVGACDDMPAAYMLADVVVVPSVGPEAFGRTSIEAQAMGRPVIATDRWGLSETIMPAATGWLVQPNDAVGLADAVDLALALPEDASARLAARARRFIERHYSIQRMGKSTLSVYRELLDGRKPLPSLLPDTPIDQR
jgi:glycosyltransferase involved in cell wall biosynthesis